MPALDTIDRIGRLQQRIRELEEGKEIDAKHIDLLLGDEGTKAFDTEWKRQQGLRKVKKPAALNMVLLSSLITRVADCLRLAK